MTERTDIEALFAERRDRCVAEIENLLDQILADAPQLGETARPARLLSAMRHASLGGGKRLRPFLVVETAALFQVPRERSLLVGAALECIHCYSLVHDDLPAMDNDDLRRGRPTVHKAFDDATAILAGDALLTLAFDLLAHPGAHPDAAIRCELVSAAARSSGLGGMVGGQMRDLEAEGRYQPDGHPLDLKEHAVAELQRMKTGALLRLACLSGPILAGVHGEERRALDRYGATLGQVFQISDDLLDAEGESASMGKAARKDAAAGKATLVNMLGIDGARARCADLVQAAEAALEPFGQSADVLRAAARFAASRSA